VQREGRKKNQRRPSPTEEKGRGIRYLLTRKKGKGGKKKENQNRGKVVLLLTKMGGRGEVLGDLLATG